MLTNLLPLFELCHSKKIRIEIEPSDGGIINVAIQNMLPVDGSDKDGAALALKPVLSSPLLLSGTVEQLESGLPQAINEYVRTLREVSNDLQCNLKAIKVEAEKAKEKAALAAKNRGKKATKKPAPTPIGAKANERASDTGGSQETQASPAPVAVKSESVESQPVQVAQPKQPSLNPDQLF
ncbi:hypothetical protein [Endozoicomonas sp. ALC066]|uniref:hypothetical protein n=1 Tax=Endozoicomonas sp. ALC066 TaxID=3403078 RepID=UPI003BB66772